MGDESLVDFGGQHVWDVFDDDGRLVDQIERFVVVMRWFGSKEEIQAQARDFVMSGRIDNAPESIRKGVRKLVAGKFDVFRGIPIIE